jgi:hypothetical protein
MEEYSEKGVMMKKAYILILVISIVFIAACVSVNATKLGTGNYRRPVAAAEVAVYRTADQVPGKYEEIALLNAKGDSAWSSESGMFKQMKKKAGQMGANGIILDAVSEPSAGAKIAGAIFGVGAERKGKAIAIFVFPPEEE